MALACSLAIAGAVRALLIMVAGCAMAQTRRCEDYSLKSEYPVRLCNPPSIAGEDDDALVAYSLACRNPGSYGNYAGMLGADDPHERRVPGDLRPRAVAHQAFLSGMSLPALNILPKCARGLVIKCPFEAFDFRSPPLVWTRPSASAAAHARVGDQINAFLRL